MAKFFLSTRFLVLKSWQPRFDSNSHDFATCYSALPTFPLYPLDLLSLKASKQERKLRNKQSLRSIWEEEINKPTKHLLVATATFIELPLSLDLDFVLARDGVINSPELLRKVETDELALFSNIKPPLLSFFGWPFFVDSQAS